MSSKAETPEIDTDVRIAELAKLSSMEYDQVRIDEAAKLKVRPGTLDKEVLKARGESEQKEAQGRQIQLYEPEPWDEPVSGDDALQDAYRLIMRHMVMRDEDAIACALWVAHTYIYTVFDHTPRLLITAPDAECGKTVLMTHMVGNMVNKPQSVELMKAAPFFRLAEAYHPTYLIDEMDVFIKDDSDLLAAVNNGWEPHGGVPRCVGEDNEVRIFSTHCPVAMAGIELNKKLPTTTISRSVVINLERAAIDEINDDDIYDSKLHKKTLLIVGRKLARWCKDNKQKIKHAKPMLPPKTRNRLADKWAPLFAIAQVAGGEWPGKANRAMFGQVDMSEPSKGLMLLSDAISVFIPGENRVTTKELIKRICEIEDAPWSDYNFKQRDDERRHIQDRQVANLLRRYNVHPENVKIGGKVPKGYKREELQQAINRYIPLVPPELAATPLPLSKHKGFNGSLAATPCEKVADKNTLKPLCNKEGSGVAAILGGTRGDACENAYTEEF